MNVRVIRGEWIARNGIRIATQLAKSSRSGEPKRMPKTKINGKMTMNIWHISYLAVGNGKGEKMKKIVVDEMGEPIDELALRNEEIKKALEPKLQQFVEREQSQLALTKKSLKWGLQFQMQIVEELHKYPLLSAEKFADLTADDIWDYYCKFHSLLAHYNMYTEIIPNVELFMGFLGINMRMYMDLKKGGINQDEDIVAIINYLETDVLGIAWGAIDHGNADVKAVSKRISAKGVHEVISASEDKIINEVAALSPTQIQKQVASVLGIDQKALK